MDKFQQCRRHASFAKIRCWPILSVPLQRKVVRFVTVLLITLFSASGMAAEIKPEDAERIGKLLERADSYFTYGWLTSPRHKNAYALYQKVMTLDPLNRHATEKIFEIGNYYRDRGEEIQAEGNAELAGMYQHRYQKIIEYLLKEVLKPQFDILNQTFRQLQEQQRDGIDVQQELSETLDSLIQVLQDMETIYRQFPDEKFQTMGKQLQEKREQYQQLRDRL